MIDDYEVLEITLPTETVATEAVTMVVMDAEFYQLTQQTSLDQIHTVLFGAFLIVGFLFGFFALGGRYAT